MLFNLRALFCALAVLSTFEPILAGKTFGGGGRRSHSYPKSGGLSGGSSHSYPSSGGLSGGGHGYPSSGGMSGGGHGYPSSRGMSGGSHGYPSSGGMSGGSRGYPSSGGSHAYPANTGNSGYPSNTHHSNTHGYPSGKGLSGNSQPAAGHTTVIHNNYHYSPPQQIRYTPMGGGAPINAPVYHGTPPTYVYQYKDSGSKYGTLLTGLALLNLGTLAAGTAYAVSHNSHGGGSGSGGYTPRPDEVCKFGIRKDNGYSEETKIDCRLITSFQTDSQNGGGNNATVTTTTVTNVTVVNTTNGAAVPLAAAPAPDTPATSTVYTMFPNGTLVPLNMTTTTNATNNAPGGETTPNNTMTSSMTVTTTTTNTTVTNAQEVKGSPIPVTPGMKCYVIRQSPITNMRKPVDCGLLQTYAEKSIRPNSAASHAPAFTILAALVAFVLY